MAELTFESRVTWWGRERAGTGVLTTGQPRFASGQRNDGGHYQLAADPDAGAENMKP